MLMRMLISSAKSDELNAVPKGKPSVVKAMMVAKYALNVARNDKPSATKTTAVKLRRIVAKQIRTTSAVLNASKTGQNVAKKFLSQLHLSKPPVTTASVTSSGANAAKPARTVVIMTATAMAISTAAGTATVMAISTAITTATVMAVWIAALTATMTSGLTAATTKTAMETLIGVMTETTTIVLTVLMAIRVSTGGATTGAMIAAMTGAAIVSVTAITTVPAAIIRRIAVIITAG